VQVVTAPDPDLFTAGCETPAIWNRRRPPKRIRSVDDWRTLAAPAGGERQWRAGRSALEGAHAWFRRPTVPAELQRMFAAHIKTRGLRVASVFPEHKTHFRDGSFGPRNHDLLLFGTAGGRRTLVGVEVKADEGLDLQLAKRIDRSLSDRSRGKATRFPERADRFSQSLFGFPARGATGGVDPRVAAIPYQLLSGVAGTLVEAARHDADQAVFVVHVLDSGSLDKEKLAANEDGLRAFCKLLDLRAPKQSDEWLIGPANYPGSDELPQLPLFIGFAHGRC
jgi:hypothetical protein